MVRLVVGTACMKAHVLEKEKALLRDQDSMIEHAYQAIEENKPFLGVKGPTSLNLIPNFDVARGVVPDIMHVLSSICTPDDMPRIVRSYEKHGSDWKANEDIVDFSCRSERKTKRDKVRAKRGKPGIWKLSGTKAEQSKENRKFGWYPHKVWKHDEFFRAFNTAAYGPKCLPFLRDNSRLSYRKANPKKSSC
ncbi:hypothetical protein OUZ56_011408 [Daphnia magna]|uniref:Uncharacterized protein n=1 Tax=Daphnia magna TaxID=35525 RepID=A0ABQ9Z039_9CRUS|nr:hypothetical protein OUZ56_011408 [Daphnia magna]